MVMSPDGTPHADFCTPQNYHHFYLLLTNFRRP